MSSASIWLPHVLITASIILQSTVLQNVTIKGVIPDLSLLFLIFFAIREGSMKAQIGGFIAGMVQDFLSTSPLGFYTFIRTVIGFLYGLLKGKVFVDPIFMPMILVSVATLLKAILSFFVGILLLPEGMLKPFFGVTLWVEIGMNVVIAPFLFGFLKLFKIFKIKSSGGIR